MILVLLGTGPASFERLLDAVQAWVDRTGERVVAQCGHTPCEKYDFECYSFVDHEKLIKWVDEAEVVITQGGFGALRECIQARKSTVAVARNPMYGEVLGDQLDLIKELERAGWIIVLKCMGELEDAIKKARNLILPTKFKSDIPALIEEKISNILGM